MISFQLSKSWPQIPCAYQPSHTYIWPHPTTPPKRSWEPSSTMREVPVQGQGKTCTRGGTETYSWWLQQAMWKWSSSNWIISQCVSGRKHKKYLRNDHLAKIKSWAQGVLSFPFTTKNPYINIAFVFYASRYIISFLGFTTCSIHLCGPICHQQVIGT